MIGQVFSAYSEYQDSGIDWLGKIPKHWEVCELRRKLQNGQGIKIGPFGSQLKLEFMQETGFKVYGQENIIWNDFTLGTRYIGEDKFNELSTCSIQPNDVLVTMMGTSGRCQVVPENIELGLIDSHLLRLRVKNDELQPRFISILIDKSPYVQEQLRASGKGTIMHGLNSALIKEILIAIPPIPEQKQIATFLDPATTEIDQIIEQQKQLITLLEEERTTVISHAVTKGLDPSVPMKDSGIEWLGEIPKHWELKKIKHVVHEIIDTEHKTAPFEPDGEYLVVRTSNVRDGKLVFDDAKYTDIEGFKEWTRRGVPNAGDILFTREAPAGEACIVPEDIDLCLGQRMVLFRVNPDLLDSNYCVRSIYGGIAAEFIHSLSSGSTVVHFNMADIKNIPIFIPPVKEQKEIASFLDQETARIDEAIDNVRSQIEKLEEYRTVLISDAVTGKIDVRGFNKE